MCVCVCTRVCVCACACICATLCVCACGRAVEERTEISRLQVCKDGLSL